MDKINVRLALYAVAFVLALLVLFGSFEIINPSERAVRVTAGQVSPVVYGNGVQLKWPIFSHFEVASVEPRIQDVKIEVGSDGAISSDNQTIGLKATVAWNYDTSRMLVLVKEYPNREKLEELVNNTAYEAIKAEIGKYKIFNLAGSAGKIAADARAAAAQKLKAFPVVITQVNLTNWDWSDDFDAQIKATMNATQQVTKAEAEANRIQQEQRALVIKAEAGRDSAIATAQGQKQAKILSAEGDKASAELRADARRAEGAGENDYNKFIAQNMPVEIKLRELNIELKRAERWDGRQVSQYLPLTAGGTIVEIPSK